MKSFFCFALALSFLPFVSTGHAATGQKVDLAASGTKDQWVRVGFVFNPTQKTERATLFVKTFYSASTTACEIQFKVENQTSAKVQYNIDAEYHFTDRTQSNHIGSGVVNAHSATQGGLWSMYSSKTGCPTAIIAEWSANW